MLRASRPTAVNLFWAIQRMLDLVDQAPGETASVEDLRAILVAEAQRIADEDVEINRRMAANGAASN